MLISRQMDSMKRYYKLVNGGIEKMITKEELETIDAIYEIEDLEERKRAIIKFLKEII